MGYGRIYENIYEDERQDIYTLAIYPRLCSMCYGDNDCCWPSLNTLCENLHIGKPRLIKGIKHLEETGWLYVERSKDSTKGNKSNKYYPLIIDTNTCKKTTLNGKVVSQSNQGSNPQKLGVVTSDDQGSNPRKLGVVTHDYPNNINKIIETNNRNRITENNSCCNKKKADKKCDNTTAISIISHLNNITGLQYRVTQSVNKQIEMLLANGYSVNEIEEVINHKAKRFKDIDKLYLTKPSLFFNFERFEEYAQEVINEIIQEEQELERSHVVSMITDPDFVRSLNHG